MCHNFLLCSFLPLRRSEHLRYSFLLCVPSDSASSSILVCSVRQQLEAFYNFCGDFKSVWRGCAGQRSKINNEEICDAALQKVSVVTRCLVLAWLKCFWELQKNVKQAANSETYLKTSYHFSHKGATQIQDVLEPQMTLWQKTLLWRHC